jgi:hypothetical protein
MFRKHNNFNQIFRIVFVLSVALFFSAANVRASSHKKTTPEAATNEKALNLPIDDLTGKGLELEVHAAVHDYWQYVGTLRKSDDFFVNEQFPLVPDSPNLFSEFLKLKRHDRIRVKGTLVNPRNPQRHIRVTRLEIIKPYETELPHHNYEMRLPQDLRASGKIRALVHAVTDGGSVMLIDYRGAVIPVVVRRPTLARNLYRNDTVEIDYVLAESPTRPPHMMLNPRVRSPLKVLYSIVSEHGKNATREGFLVMFPKSPQVQFNVFALEATNSLGLKHNYTLVNFESAEEFKKIREKLQAVWDAAPQDRVFNARNRLQNPRIRVTARGTLNEVDPSQANPQVLLKSVDDLSFQVEEKTN